MIQFILNIFRSDFYTTIIFLILKIFLHLFNLYILFGLMNSFQKNHLGSLDTTSNCCIVALNVILEIYSESKAQYTARNLYIKIRLMLLNALNHRAVQNNISLVEHQKNKETMHNLLKLEIYFYIIMQFILLPISVIGALILTMHLLGHTGLICLMPLFAIFFLRSNL